MGFVYGKEYVREPGVVLVGQPELLQGEGDEVQVGHVQRDAVDAGCTCRALRPMSYRVICTEGENTPTSAGPAKVLTRADSMDRNIYICTHVTPWLQWVRAQCTPVGNPACA